MILCNLSVLMAERGLKIADVYERTGISKTTLMSLSENKGKGVQFETVDKLCNFFEVTPAEFFLYSPYIFSFKKNISFDNEIEIVVTGKKGLQTDKFTFGFDDDYADEDGYVSICSDSNELRHIFNAMPKPLQTNFTKMMRKAILVVYEIDKDYELSIHGQILDKR